MSKHSKKSITIKLGAGCTETWTVYDEVLDVCLGSVGKFHRDMLYYPSAEVRGFGLTATELRQIADRMDHA